jgi:Domain of unknown function (DUF1707)
VRQRGSLRASDSDREQVVDRLRKAAAEGRLLAEELEHRLGVALSARTYGELDAVLADLPGPRGVERRKSSELGWVRPALVLAIAIPVVVALVAAVVFVVTGVLAIWMLWVVIGWWCFGHKHRMHGGTRHGRGADQPVAMHGARRAQARPRGWL